MASNNIVFKIGSTFEGEGFKRAREAVGAINKDAKGGSMAMNALANSIGVMDGKAAKAVSAVTGMLSSVMSLNPVVLGITAAISAFSWALNELREHEEAVKKAAEDLRKSHEELATKINQQIFDKAISDAKALGAEYDRITKHANEMTSAINALNNQTASGGILQLQADKVVAVFNEISEEGKQLVAAEYDLKIATAEAALMRQRAEQNLEAASQAVADQEGEIENLLQQRAGMEIQLNRLQENNVAFETASREEREKWLKNIADLQARMAEVDSRIIAGNEKLEVLQVKEQTAVEARNAAEIQATTKIETCTQKQAELEAEIEKRAAEEAQAAEIAKAQEEGMRLEIEARENQRMMEEELAKAEKDAADAVKKAEQAQKDQAAAAEALKNAELAYASKMSDYINSGMATFDAANGLVQSEGKGLRGGQIPVDVQKSIQTTVADQKVDDAIRNGAVSTVKEMGKLNRQGMREARDLINKTQNQQLREAQAYKRLKEMNPKALASSDKVFMERYEKLLKANEDRKQELKNAKDAVDKQAENVKKTAQNMDEVVKMMKGLGLK